MPEPSEITGVPERQGGNAGQSAMKPEKLLGVDSIQALRLPSAAQKIADNEHATYYIAIA